MSGENISGRARVWQVGPDSPRIESAHVVVTLHASVHDSSITLFSDAFLGHLFVGPLGITPHGVIDLSKFNGSTGVVLDGKLEGVVEVPVVQKHVRIVEPSVEMSLDGFERFDHAIDLLVSGKNHEGGVGSLAFHFFVDETTASGKHLIVFFADFPAVTGWLG